ncbi:MAG: polysaccharide deacetylase family protein [Bacteroidota bacterium]
MLTTFILFVLILMVVVCLFLTIQYSLFLPPVKGLPVLMYHKVSLDTNDPLTISIQNLEKHFGYLSENAYTCLDLNQVIDNKTVKLPVRSFVLTFDDAYLNNLEYLYPLLQKYGFHATIMLPVGFLGKINGWDQGSDPIMSYQQLLSMDSRFVSFGLHTYGHISLKNSSFADITADLDKSKQELTSHGIRFLPVLAYPYGAYPKESVQKKALFDLLEKSGIRYGFRIGNKINKWPIKNRYEVKRIDIRGDDSFWTFKTKLRKGRVKMF